jgi:hypothetical protein
MLHDTPSDAHLAALRDRFARRGYVPDPTERLDMDDGTVLEINDEAFDRAYQEFQGDRQAFLADQRDEL